VSATKIKVETRAIIRVINGRANGRNLGERIFNRGSHGLIERRHGTFDRAWRNYRKKRHRVWQKEIKRKRKECRCSFIVGVRLTSFAWISSSAAAKENCETEQSRRSRNPCGNLIGETRIGVCPETSTACRSGSIMEYARRRHARVDVLGTRRRSLNHQNGRV